MPHEPASISPEVLQRVRARAREPSAVSFTTGSGLQFMRYPSERDKRDAADLRALLAEREALLEALKPFARFEQAGWCDTAWEYAKDDEDVLFNHRTGDQITAGDFRRAAAMMGGKG